MAKSDLSSALPKAKNISARLNSATDALNSVVVAAEEAIAALKLGVPGYVAMRTDSDPSVDWERGLSFRREGKVWKLFVESGPSGDPDNTSQTPLTNCSRDTRLEAVDLLPALVENMIETAEREVSEVETKTERVLQFIAQLSAQKAK